MTAATHNSKTPVPSFPTVIVLVLITVFVTFCGGGAQQDWERYQESQDRIMMDK